MSITPNTAPKTDPESVILRTEDIPEMARQLVEYATSVHLAYSGGLNPADVDSAATALATLGTDIANLTQRISSAAGERLDQTVRPQHLNIGHRFLDPHSGEWLTVTDTPSPAFIDPTKTMVPVDRACDDIDSDPFVLIPTFGQVEVQA